MGRAKGAVNYQNKVLIPIISQLLPNSSLGWQAVAIEYQKLLFYTHRITTAVKISHIVQSNFYSVHT